MGSSLAAVVLALLLEARLCDFASINSADALRKCTDQVSAGVPMSKRCDDLNRVCRDGTPQSNAVTCGDCKEGFVKDPIDSENIKACIPLGKCTDRDSSGVPMSKRCDDLHRVCKDGTPESNAVTCGECKEGFLMNPTDSENKKMCIPVHWNSCHDQMPAEGITFHDFCSKLNRVCVDPSYPHGKPNCGGCMEGYVYDEQDYSRCRRAGCPPIKELANGKLEGDCQTAEAQGDSCKFTCNPGFVLQGSKEIFCMKMSSGFQWNTHAPFCEVISCSISSIPKAESLSGDCYRAKPNSQCTLYCDTGYELFVDDQKTGEKEVTCQKDGTWGVKLSCKKVKCKSPPDFQHSDLGKDECRSAVEDETCTAKCKEGYILYQGEEKVKPGEEVMTCMYYGSWSWTPTCKAATCTDWKPSTGENWNAFCRKQENRECVVEARGYPPTCACKDNCRDYGDGTCTCEEQRYLIKGVFAIILDAKKLSQLNSSSSENLIPLL